MVNPLRLGSWQTHLPLRQRARLLLQDERRREAGASISPEQVAARLKAACHILGNALRYQERHLPGWHHLPQELRHAVEASQPCPGSPEITTMLALRRQAQELAQLDLPAITEPTDEEVDALVAAYLAARQEERHRRAGQ